MKIMIKILIALTVAVTFINAQDLSGFLICVDPGHGGHESDDRNMTWADFWESESNLSKAYFLDTLLTNLGATVVLTRHYNGNSGSDNDPGLSERAAVANNAGADFFHSIHSNGGGNANYTLILYPGPSGDPRINGVSGYPSSPIELTLSNQMATQIYASNRTTYKTTAGDWTFYGSGGPWLGVFASLTLPGSLSEGSFHDYYPETYRLKNSAYHKNEAWAIARTYALVLDSTDFPTYNLAGIVRDPEQTVSYTYLTANDYYKPVNDITATLYPGGKVCRGDSLNNGYYLFDSLAAGTYKVVVEAEGYYSDSSEVTIGSSFFNFQDFFLYTDDLSYIKSTSPADADSSFPAWDPITITFTRPMDTTLTKAAISITPEIPLIFTWSSTRVLNITSDSLDYLNEYTITIAGTAQDAHGYLLDGNNDGTAGDGYTFTFKTGPEDMTAPKVTSFYPAYNATGVELYPIISFYFDEKLDTTTLSDDMFVFYNSTDGDTLDITWRHYYVGDISVIYIIPTEALAAGKMHRAYVYCNGVADLFGNTMTSYKVTRFTTTATNWELTSIDNFESGLDNWWAPASSGSTTGIDPTSARSENTEIYYFGDTGQQSMKLSVDWDTTATAWLLREYLSGGTPRSVTFTADKVMQAYIFGDGSNVLFRFAVDDGSSYSGHEVSPWYTVDWLGWKLVSWDMATDGTGTWIGDGTLNGTMRFDSFQLSYDDSLSAVSSTLYIDNLRVVSVTSTGIDSEKPAAARQFWLHQNYPNPFNPTTTIAFTLPEASNVRIEVFNVLGERVRTLTNCRYNTGSYSVVWDGQNESGTLVPSGVYFYRMISDLGVQVRNMMLLK